MCSGRIVTIVFLIALEILTIKSNVNAFVIKQDPKKLAGVMAEIEELNGGTGGFNYDTPNDNDKMIDMKHDGKTSSTAPIETTAKTEEIQKSTPKTTTTNKPVTTSTSKPQTTVNKTTETTTTINKSKTKITDKPETTTTHTTQPVTTSETSYIDGNPTLNTHNNAPTQTTVDFLLDNTETETTGSTFITNANIKETTEMNITTGYSIEAVENDATGRSDVSSTTEIDDNGFTLSNISLPIPKSQDKETTVISIKSTTSSDVLTTDYKPLHWKKYITIDRKRNNIDLINAETLPTTEKDYDLSTAETKHQNPKNNDDFVSTPEWYYDNVKQEAPTSTETDTTTKIYNYDLPNSINQNQALPTTENIHQHIGHQSPIFKDSFQEIRTSTGPALLSVTLSNQYNSSSQNFKISQSTSESHGTSTAVSQTNTPRITSTLFFSTTDIPKAVSLTETSKDLTTIDFSKDLSQNYVSKNISTTEAKTEQFLSTSDESSLRSPRAYNVTEAVKATESIKSINEITSEKIKGVLTSKRAGYLDMSSKPTLRTEITTTGGKTITGRVEIGDAKKTTPIAEPGSTTDRQVYYMQSQSQLSEDALNEELMKEEMMNDQIGYTQQNREQRKDKDPATEKTYKGHATDKVDKDPATEKLTITTDDILSVKPIGVDKQKTSGLYTVSPNYKPLKKIEVQPPKPFVRDPDDNSWRNESLSSLGIVFKANNSSKPLTQVLKNKTETEFNSLLEKYGKSDEPELRARLEKIAEQRKTKKKIGEKSGETGDSDSYEALNFFAESSSSSAPEVHTVEIAPSVSPIPKSSPAISSSTTVESDNFVKFSASMEERSKISFLTTTAPKKYSYGSFDGSDEEPDYSSLSDIDIKKTHVEKNDAAGSTAGSTQSPVPPERKATVQYFPPRATQPAKVNLNDYDYDFKRKVQALEQDKLVSPLVYSSSPTPGPTRQKSHSSQQQTVKDVRLIATDVPRQQFTNVFTQSPEIPQFDGKDGFNGVSYVIKHLRDFVHLAARESEEDRVAYLTVPPRLPIHGGNAHGHHKDKVKPRDYEEYDTHFRQNVLDRFVDNFNQNSERFKVDFPVLYNTSIIHNNFADESKQASSSAFMKRLYESPRVSRGPGAGEADCNRAVELTPEYELHYYVPEQEEREVAHSEQLLSPVRYQLRL